MSGCQTTRDDTAMAENVSSSEFTFTIILTIIISDFVTVLLQKLKNWVCTNT